MDWLPYIAIGIVAALIGWRQSQAEARLRALIEAPKPADPTIPMLQNQVEALRGQVQQSLDALRGQMQTSLTDSAGSTRTQLSESLTQLVNQLASVQTALDERMKTSSELVQQTTQQVGERLDNAAKVVGEVQNRLGTLEAAGQRIFEVGKDLSSLQEILRSQKARGVFGEQMLENLLTQILPRENVVLQHGFKDGEKVDALVRLADGNVAIDAKFPLENFQKALAETGESERNATWKKFGADVRKHIDAIARKYIRPDEGTLGFALMYIPAESVYYETLFGAAVNQDGESVPAYAQKKNVVIVSPSTLFAYLQTIMLGLKGLQIEQEAETIRDNLARLRGDLDKFRDAFGVMGKHLREAGSRYDDAEKRLGKFSDRLQSVAEPGAAPTAESTPEADPADSTPSKPPRFPIKPSDSNLRIA